MPSVLPGLTTQRWSDRFRGVDPHDGIALFLRLLEDEVQLDEWETVELQNGSRLAVYASPNHQRAIAGVCQGVREQADIAVVMNARIYEVDRVFFATHVAPLLIGKEIPNGLLPAGIRVDERPLIVPIDRPLLKNILNHKLVLESEDNRIRPRATTAFLSHLVPFRYAAGVPLGHRGEITGSGMHGVRFKVRPEVGPDGLWLRLRITQHATRLIGISKAKQLDQTTGAEREVETPMLQRSTATGMITLADGDPLLMPIDYRPPGKAHADKVWLLVARPTIWNHEEDQDEQAGIKRPRPQSIWERPTTREQRDAEPPPPAPPLTDDVREVLQAVVTHALTDLQLKHTRDFYGTAKDKDKTVALVGGAMGWPRDFRPDAHGFKRVKPPLNSFDYPRRVLGIALQKFEVQPPKSKAGGAPRQASEPIQIQLLIFNAGGSANGAVIGGCHVSYAARRIGKRWHVEMREAFDP